MHSKNKIVKLMIYTTLWVFLTFVALIIVSIIFIAAINFATNTVFRRSSRVDISPIATLSGDQLGHVVYALKQLEEQGYIYRVSGHRISPDSYFFRWTPEGQLSNSYAPRLGISRDGYRFPPPERAWLPYDRNIHIINDNGTEVVMIPPWMSVSVSGLYLPSSERYFRTYILFGDTVLRLDEVRLWNDMRNNYSSQFIAALVNAMQDEY